MLEHENGSITLQRLALNTYFILERTPQIIKAKQTRYKTKYNEDSALHAVALEAFGVGIGDGAVAIFPEGGVLPTLGTGRGERGSVVEF